jgi:hypothetical protein
MKFHKITARPRNEEIFPGVGNLILEKLPERSIFFNQNISFL